MVADLFSDVSAKFIRSICDHIDYSNNNVSLSATPYPNALVPYFESSDIKSIVSNDVIQINDL